MSNGEIRFPGGAENYLVIHAQLAKTEEIAELLETYQNKTGIFGLLSSTRPLNLSQTGGDSAQDSRRDGELEVGGTHGEASANLHGQSHPVSPRQASAFSQGSNVSDKSKRLKNQRLQVVSGSVMAAVAQSRPSTKSLDTKES